MTMIIINDKKYDPADLTPEQQQLHAQIMACRNKMNVAASDLQIAQVAEQQFSQALINSVEAPAEEAPKAPAGEIEVEAA